MQSRQMEILEKAKSSGATPNTSAERRNANDIQLLLDTKNH